jgi:hypothetical protein
MIYDLRFTIGVVSPTRELFSTIGNPQSAIRN